MLRFHFWNILWTIIGRGRGHVPSADVTATFLHFRILIKPRLVELECSRTFDFHMETVFEVCLETENVFIECVKSLSTRKEFSYSSRSLFVTKSVI